MLNCNSCHQHVDGIAYRTRCGHFYCPQCAKKTFQHGTSCMICNASLSEIDVHEITIGIPTTLESMMTSLFQTALQTPAYGQIQERLQQITNGAAEVNNFFTAQLMLESSDSVIAKKKLEQDFHSQADHLVGNLQTHVVCE